MRGIHSPLPLKAVGYIRVSTDEQASEGQSLDNQLSRIRAYAESQGWDLVDVYREEGHSGKTTNRPELNRLIGDVRSDKVDIVLVYRVDRLTRRQKHLWTLLEDVFEANGVGFKSVVEPFDTTTAQGKAFLGMLAVFAQLERDTISERTRDTLASKKANGEWSGRIPYGYRIGDNRKLEKDLEQQKVIGKVKRLRRRGRSFRAIARQLGISHMTVSNLLNDHMKIRNGRYIYGLSTPAVK